MTLAWWWILSCLPLQSPVPLHLSGGTGGRGDGGGPGPGGGFCGHFFPGAWFVKTLGQGVCACCVLGLSGELVSQFSLRPCSQVGLLPLDVGFRPLHHLLVRC